MNKIEMACNCAIVVGNGCYICQMSGDVCTSLTSEYKCETLTKRPKPGICVDFGGMITNKNKEE